jgi:hypothetical protein
VGLFRRRSNSSDDDIVSRVEENRAAAQALRRDNPALYDRAIAEGMDSGAADAVRNDPDAWVALWLSEARKAGIIGTSPDEDNAAAEAGMSDRDYWPTLDLQAINDRLAEGFTQREAEVGGPVVYPTWAVRRNIAFELLATAGLIDFKVSSDLQSILDRSHPSEEDPALDEAVDRLLRKHHLTEPFQILLDGFTSPRDDV